MKRRAQRTTKRHAMAVQSRRGGGGGWQTRQGSTCEAKAVLGRGGQCSNVRLLGRWRSVLLRVGATERRSARTGVLCCDGGGGWLVCLLCFICVCAWFVLAWRRAGNERANKKGGGEQLLDFQRLACESTQTGKEFTCLRYGVFFILFFFRKFWWCYVGCCVQRARNILLLHPRMGYQGRGRPG